MSHKHLYYLCTDCTNLWKVNDGSIPKYCPVCKNPHSCREIGKENWEDEKRLPILAFKDYQYRNNDYKPGAKARFYAKRFGLPVVEENLPVLNDFYDFCEEMGWNISKK